MQGNQIYAASQGSAICAHEAHVFINESRFNNNTGGAVVALNGGTRSHRLLHRFLLTHSKRSMCITRRSSAIQLRAATVLLSLLIQVRDLRHLCLI